MLRELYLEEIARFRRLEHGTLLIREVALDGIIKLAEKEEMLRECLEKYDDRMGELLEYLEKYKTESCFKRTLISAAVQRDVILTELRIIEKKG